MTNDLMPFTSLAEMLDAVLEALPPGPETIKLASPGEKREHELLVRAIEAIRQGRSFAFDGFDLNADIFYKIANQGGLAFAAGCLAAPSPASWPSQHGIHRSRANIVDDQRDDKSPKPKPKGGRPDHHGPETGGGPLRGGVPKPKQPLFRVPEPAPPAEPAPADKMKAPGKKRSRGSLTGRPAGA